MICQSTNQVSIEHVPVDCLMLSVVTHTKLIYMQDGMTRSIDLSESKTGFIH